MPIIQDIITMMEQLAPLNLAETWDNPGLMVGDRYAAVTGVLTTLDITHDIIKYAINQNCNLIISHHPLIFKGLKHLDKSDSLGGMIFSLIENNIAVYSAHTNLDIAQGGLNDMLGQALSLTDIQGLIKTSSNVSYKVTTFCPVEDGDSIRQAMADAGAGVIGNYSDCSFTSIGVGRFKGNGKSMPVVGERETMCEVEEEHISVIVDTSHLSPVLAALMKSHPYEEVAYEVMQLESPKQDNYLGRIGMLPMPMTMDEFKQHIQNSLGISQIRFGGAPCDVIKRIAICSGAGAGFINELNTNAVDAYITGDAKYHDAQLAREKGLLVVDAGHFGTEHIVAKGLAEYLEKESNNCGLDFTRFISYNEQKDFFF